MKSLLLTASLLALAAAPAYAEPADNASMAARIAKLEEELQLLKRQQEVQTEKAATVAEKAASVEYGKEGLKIASPDQRYTLRLRGYVQADTRSFFDNSNTSNVDQFVIRTARPIIEATFDKDFSARLMLDFGNNQSRLLDAYVDYKPDPMFNIRLGKLKSPIGLERWESEQEILFVERGMATNLVPFRDIGLQFSGDLIPQTLEYQFLVSDGTSDLGDPNAGSNDTREYTARLFSHPFRNSDTVALQGLGIGLAGSIGNRDGTTSNTQLTDGYRTPAQAKFFTYRTGTLATDITYANGEKWRINPQSYYYNGPFGALAEYVVTQEQVRRNTSTANLQHNGLTAIASYVLTGEDASFDGVKPRSNFSLKGDGIGAWEVLARYGELHLDDATFPFFADQTKSARAAYERTLGLTWYANYNLKFNFNYSYTTFDGGAAGGADREAENVLMTRAQFRF